MRGRLIRFGLVALVPTAIDVGLLVVLRQGLGWVLVLADLTAIAIASAVSYVLHRTITFRSDPYVRWVRLPWVFLCIAAIAAVVDVVILRLVFAGTGFDTTAGLVAAKGVALIAAAAVRMILYRLALVRAIRRSGEDAAPRPALDGDLDVSIVIPAFNEADGIATTIGRLRAAAGGSLELVVVDDGSSDDTADRALAAGADQVIVLDHNRGKGAAVRAGVLAARGRAVAFTDADLAYDPALVLRVARPRRIVGRGRRRP